MDRAAILTLALGAVAVLTGAAAPTGSALADAGSVGSVGVLAWAYLDLRRQITALQSGGCAWGRAKEKDHDHDHGGSP